MHAGDLVFCGSLPRRVMHTLAVHTSAPAPPHAHACHRRAHAASGVSRRGSSRHFLAHLQHFKLLLHHADLVQRLQQGLFYFQQPPLARPPRLPDIFCPFLPVLHRRLVRRYFGQRFQPLRHLCVCVCARARLRACVCVCADRVFSSSGTSFHGQVCTSTGSVHSGSDGFGL